MINIDTKSIFDILYKDKITNVFSKNKILDILIKDMTSKKNIIWATHDYSNLGVGYQAGDSILISSLYGNVVQRRSVKDRTNQKDRIKSKAEVFTASWICNIQNSLIDEQWFGKSNVFNIPKDHSWDTLKSKIEFPKNKTWQDYILCKRMEVSCGEAPYLVSRYDTTTGEPIAIIDRIGMLDRKLRIINENVDVIDEWFTWVEKAFQSVYGFEYQGDNLFLARENLLITFIENMEYKFKVFPTDKQLKSISKIISWNLWQMDALSYKIPKYPVTQKYEQFSLLSKSTNSTKNEYMSSYCKIKDWSIKSNKGRIIEYKSLIKEKNNG
ncbi:restriction endonuclease subunit M [Clostridium perfringens]